MTQFDIHRNPGRNRAAIPYVVVIQSRRFDQTRTRVVVPLMHAPLQPSMLLEVMPSFHIDGQDLVMNPLEMFTAPLSALGRVVGSLADEMSSSRIVINALDLLFSRVYG
jgi:toxin CcdB